MHDKILILDFGSQVTQLIARRVREAHVYCEIHPNDVGDAFIREFAPKAIILSGSHASTYEEHELRAPQAVWDLGVPVLGICYGMFAMAVQQGSADRYFQEGDSDSSVGSAKLVPEGIEGQVPYKGSLVAIVFQMAGGLRAAMHYCGCASIEDMHERCEFVEISAAAMRESHVHDVQITKEAPNYRME